MRFSLAVAAALASTNVVTATLRSFGTGVSQGSLDIYEVDYFNYNVSSDSTTAMITHWWITGGASVDKATIRFYINGEDSASIQFQPYLACGTGFDDTTAPWGNEMMGKGSSLGGWYNNIRIPFSKSVRVTLQGVQKDVVYFIVRGSEDLPLVVGDITLPATARLSVNVNTITNMAPLQYVDVISAPDGRSGISFLVTLSFAAGNLNTLEGCFHAYTPANTPYPGFIVATGTEDFFDSAYYFAAGTFRQPNAGLTHIDTSNNQVQLSAYRFLYRDPIVWGPSGGARLTWRNGDTTDPATGLKCTLQTGGNTVGSPTNANVTTLGWFYTW